jgi:hypothetical protein
LLVALFRFGRRQERVWSHLSVSHLSAGVHLLIFLRDVQRLRYECLNELERLTTSHHLARRRARARLVGHARPSPTRRNTDVTARTYRCSLVPRQITLSRSLPRATAIPPSP